MASAGLPEPSRLPAHPDLPDPLVTFDGERITSREQWFAKRRPELKLLFQHYMYGRLPPAPARVGAKLEHEDRTAFGGKATLKEITLRPGAPDLPPVHLLLVVPNRRQAPVPLFLGMNFCGNHAVVSHPAVRLPTGWMYDGYPGVRHHRATDAGRGQQADVWAIDQSVDRGYAVATFYNGDIDPDRPHARDGVQFHLRYDGRPAQPQDRGTIAAWAWGLHRAVDYLVTDADIDRGRIAVVGHSRLGKAALLAAAFDERIALAIPHQAGCGGTAPSRGKTGESVRQINDRFPHWFNGAFKAFNDYPDQLPFDQHCLVALVAPRPVLFTNATLDTWANPAGQFDVLKAADPVYRLLGAGGLDADRMPQAGLLVASRLGFYVRPGQHSMTRGDWKVFLDFADKYFGRPPSTSGPQK